MRLGRVKQVSTAWRRVVSERRAHARATRSTCRRRRGGLASRRRRLMLLLLLQGPALLLLLLLLEHVARLVRVRHRGSARCAASMGPRRDSCWAAGAPAPRSRATPGRGRALEARESTFFAATFFGSFLQNAAEERNGDERQKRQE